VAPSPSSESPHGGLSLTTPSGRSRTVDTGPVVTASNLQVIRAREQGATEEKHHRLLAFSLHLASPVVVPLSRTGGFSRLDAPPGCEHPRAGLFVLAVRRERILRSRLPRTANALGRVGVPGRGATWSNRQTRGRQVPPKRQQSSCGIVHLRLMAKMNPAEQAPQDRQRAWARRRPRSRCDLVEPAGSPSTARDAKQKSHPRVAFLFGVPCGIRTRVPTVKG
jgi:hypothetical protein